VIIPKVSSSCSALISTMIEVAPSASSLKAVDLPIPEPAPVITTIYL
jgi:hypothetical protein